MKDIQAIIFDFDGTLAELVIDFNLMKKKVAALGECFLPYRPKPGETPVLEWVEELTEKVSQQSRDEGLEFNCRCRLAITAMELDAARDGKLFDFTRPILTAFREHGIKVGVITRNVTSAVKGVFPDIEDCVDVLLARDSVQHVKPDPRHLIEALELLGVSADKALMVGEHPMDIETAKAAKVRGAGVASGRITKGKLGEAGPDFLADDVAGLVAVLQQQQLLPLIMAELK